MNCQQYQNEMEEKLDGQLTPERDSALRRHLEACPACARAWREGEGLLDLLAAAKPIAPSTGFVARTVRRATNPDEHTQGLPAWLFWPVRRLLLAWAGTAVAALVLGAGFWLLHPAPSLPPTSPPELAETYHELLDNLPVVANLDLLQDYEVIEQLDTLVEADGSPL